MEPLLDPKNGNDPLIYPPPRAELWKFREELQDMFWTEHEIEMDKDIDDWVQIEPEKKKLLGYVLAFFLRADNIVIDNLISRFYQEIQYAEARSFYAKQIENEERHAVTYKKMIVILYGDDVNGLNHIEELADKAPAVKKKLDWARKWIGHASDGVPFVQRLLAYVIVEGVLFSSSFAIIYWFARGGKFSGLKRSNDFISRDEGQHARFAAYLYRECCNEKISPAIFYEMLDEAIEIERAFIDAAITGDFTAMKPHIMMQYVKFVADNICDLLDIPRRYGATNPYEWISLNLSKKANFFEQKETAYIRSNIHKEKIDWESIFDGDYSKI